MLLCRLTSSSSADGVALPPALQTRLMDVGGDAQALAAAGNHAASTSPTRRGLARRLVIAAGYGYTAPALVGAVLGAAGLGVLTVSVRLEQRG